MPLVVTVDGLTLARGGRTLISGLSFTAASGSALVVTGANGAGKTTLLRAVAGLLTPIAGRCFLEGDGVEPEDPVGLHAHYVGHADALKGALTAAENVAFWGAALGAARCDPVAALAQVGLAHVADTPAGWLSAGQRRRVSLARLLAAPRPLWILDEPATALDAASQARLAEAMAAHRAQGGIVIAATHAALGLDDASELRLGAPAQRNAA